jgi:hypothetical protein
LKKRIPIEQVVFLKFEIEHGDARRKKIALQDISALYRRNFILSSEELGSFEAAANGILLHENQDPKVARWCLNALAQFGRLEYCKIYIEVALRKYAGIPEIQAAGIAALCKMYRGNVRDIAALTGMDPIFWKLAALQNTPAGKLDLSEISIDIDKADDELLKLALITVGLNRDVQYLFHPKHENGELIKKLCQHNNPIIQQYSIWAILENKNLSILDLGISPDALHKEAPNVQSKALQLIAELEPDPRRRLYYTEEGSCYASAEAREGLAKGVKKNYYDGLEEVTLAWFDQESDLKVREILAEHFSFFSDESFVYYEKSLAIYEADPLLHRRLLLGADGKRLFRELKTSGMRDLFENQQIEGDLVQILKNNANPKGKMVTVNVLMLAVSPIDQQNLRLDAEYRDLKEKLSALDEPKKKIKVRFETAVRTDQIQDHLLNSSPDVLHFSGHGNIGFLCFEDVNGVTQDVSGESFASMIRLFKDHIRCVVLNACFSQGVANALKADIDYVIGCDSTIDDSAAISFTRAFYQALSAGKTYEVAFEFGVASVSTAGFAREAKKYVLLKS